MRREWIEMTYDNGNTFVYLQSPSMRREWIEMNVLQTQNCTCRVSLHAEGVD